MVCPVVCKNNPGDSRQSHLIAHALEDERIRYLERIAVGVETLPERIAVALETLAANRSPFVQPDAIAAKAPRKRHSRGAKRKDADGDRRIYDAWKTGSYRTWKDCGRELGVDERHVELAVGRYRKYLKRHSGKG